MALTPPQRQLATNANIPAGQAGSPWTAAPGAAAPVTRYTTPQAPTPAPVPTSSPAPVANPTTPNPATPNPTANPGYAPTQDPILGALNSLPTSYPTPIDENSIRQGIADQMQASVDAINANANLLQSTSITPAAISRTGSTAATVANSAMAGTPAGQAQIEKTEAFNEQAQEQANAQRQSQLDDITNQINTRAQDEINAEKAAALGNTQAKVNYLQTAQTQSRQNVKDLASIGATLSADQKASLLKDSGWDPMTFDAVFNANRQRSQQIQYNYTNLGNGTILRTGVQADGTPVPEQKFNYPLNANQDFQMTPDGTPIIVTTNPDGSKSVDIASGFQQGQFAPKPTTPFASYPGQTLYTYNPQTKTWQSQTAPSTSPTSPTIGSSGSSQLNQNSTLSNFLGLYVNGNATSSAGYESGVISNLQSQGVNVSATTPLSQLQANVPQLAQAIATNEGWGKPGDVGSAINNPGNIEWPAAQQMGFDQTYGATPFTSPNGHTYAQFPDAGTGFKALQDYISQHIASASSTPQSGLPTDNSTPPPYDPHSPVDNLARTWLQTGSSNRSRQDPPEGAIEARGRAIAAQFGLPSDFNPATATADQKANLGALVDLTSQQANTQKSLDTVDQNGQLLLKGMQTAGINQNAPFVNELQNAANKKLIGSGDLAAYTNSLQTLRSEYAKLLGGRGETTDKAKGDADSALPDNISASQLQVVIKRIHDEGQNVLTSIGNTINTTRSKISGEGGSSSSSGASNLSVTTPDGQTFTFTDQNSLNQFKQEAGLP